MSKSIRFTADERRRVVVALVGKALELERKVLKQHQTAIAQEAYAEMYTTEERASMDALPNGWLQENVAIAVAGPVHETLYLARPARFTAEKLEGGYAPKGVLRKPSNKLVEAIKADAEWSRELAHKAHRLQDQVTIALKPYTTWKKFAESWPEAYQSVKDLERASSDNLPTVVPAALNAELGLTGDQTAIKPVAQAA